MNTYTILLHAHSGLRWLVLISSAVVLIKSLAGLFGGGKYAKLDNILAASFVGFMHLQFLIGIILYFISPIAKEARSAGMSGMMSDPALRFWGMEHLVMMVLAVIAAQLGRSLSKKSQDDSVKFKFQSIFFGVSLLLILFGIPWGRV